MIRSSFFCLLTVMVFLGNVASGQEITTALTRIQSPDGMETYVCRALYFDVSPPLSEMALTAIPGNKKEGFRLMENEENPKYAKFGRSAFLLAEDPVWQKQDGTYMPMILGPIQNFEGTGNLDGVMPPDTQGDVGLEHYIQVINSRLAIWTKSGTLVLAGAPLSSIWQGIPSPWAGTNDGDPVILYDQAAQRWIISQFSLPSGNYAELVAISQTSDPTGPWYRYVFQFGTDMPDYPKLGVWPDGYYLSFNKFANGSIYSGTGACALQRDKMIAGDPTAAMVYKSQGTANSDPWAMLPSDWDGSTAPPSGAPNYFIYFDDWSSNNTQYLKIWSFHVDWVTPANSTFAQTFQITPAGFDAVLCNASRGRCIPEPGGSSPTYKLEDLADRMMFRSQYRNFGSYQTLVDCHTVDVGSGVAGCRWYELRNTGSGWSIYQQGTYSPNTTYRWMPSIAMNGRGDIGLGFSCSNGSTQYPSIHYTGRLAGDPLGTMTVAEQTIINGTGSQINSNYGRWGDYSMMSVDPVDDETFWYTNEYVQTTGTFTWQTRIASFKFSNSPTVTTTAASGVSTSGGTLNGTINPNGLASTYHFEWGSTTAYGNNTTTASAGSGTSAVPVNAPITGLTTGNTYHYRLVGTNSDWTTNGNDITFIPGAAVVTTTPATAITYTTATSGGNVLSDGGSSVTARGVCYGPTANPTILGSHTTDGSGVGSFTTSLTGLTSNTLYHTRAYGTNSLSTWYGNDLTFTTPCVVYNGFPISEDFSASNNLPACWSQASTSGLTDWSISATNLAGGTGNELKATYSVVNPGTTRAMTLFFNTTGISSLSLTFNHMFDDFAAGCTAKIQTSTDGVNWTDESWTISSGGGNIGPAPVTTTITHNLNSPTTMVAFVLTGNLYNFDYWHIDNVTINAPGYWIGGTAGNLTNWNTTTNWADGVVPTATTNVVIPPRTYLPVITNDPTSPAQCNNMTILGTATVTVSSGKKLVVNGTVTMLN